MLTWEYNLVRAPSRTELQTAEGGIAPTAADPAAALIREHAGDGWALRAVHATRAGTHLLFRRPLTSGPTD
jgi:hypothetical protein